MVVADKTYTLNEYLTREARSLHKHEFYNGKIVRMAGAKARGAVRTSDEDQPISFEH